MATGRRFLGHIPVRFAQGPWTEAKGKALDGLFKRLFGSEADGIPAGFNNVTPTTVDADSVATPGLEGQGWAAADHEHAVTTGTPSSPTGKTAAEGTGVALMRADATVEQGIVTTKGDILTHDGSTAERKAVGANDRLLVADSTQTTGLDWKGIQNIPVPVDTISISLTLDGSHFVVLVDAAAAVRTILLPATATSGRRYVIKKIDSSANNVAIGGNGNNIDGAATFSLTAQHEVIEVVGDGSNWWII